MAKRVTEREVRGVAKQARIAVDADRVAALTAQVNDALAQLEPLRHARTDIRGGALGVGAGGMPLRADAGPPYAMSRPAPALAASSRAGYVLVPRLGGTAAPDRPAPRGDVPNAAVPNESVPNGSVPNESVPNASVPNATAPHGAGPGGTAPDAPGDDAPGDDAPGDDALGDDALGDDALAAELELGA